jgi:hypothetical protein
MIANILRKFSQPPPAIDHQGLTTRHETGDLYETEFDRIFRTACALDPWADERLRLRVYYHCRFAQIALNAPGDFLFAGVSFGVAPKAVTLALGPALDNRTIYLADKWQGLRESGSNRTRDDYCADVSLVRKFFTEPNVKIVEAYVPDALGQIETKHIAFAALNTGDVDADCASLPLLWPRLSTGGMLILNGYAQKPERHKQYQNTLSALPGAIVVNLMNGFGLLSKA